MTTAIKPVQLLTDAGLIVEAFISQNPGTALPAVLDLLEQAKQEILLLLPPIDAPELDPGDRAQADKEAADLEAAKFGPKP